MAEAESELQALNEIESQSESRANTSKSIKTIGCCDRIKYMFKPIQYMKTTYVEGDGSTTIVIIPETFRMWFYLCFFTFMILAYLVSRNVVDTNDNPVLNRFGANNICIYFDVPPFSLISATLWMPVTLSLLIYSFFDYYRAYDSYIDGEISKCFWIYYSISTFYEAFAIIFAIQFTATTPFESIYIHTLAFMVLTYAFWTLAFKKFLYFHSCGFFHENEYHKCWYYLGWVYCILLLITIIIRTLVVVPNLFGAYLWKQPGLEWTGPVSDMNGKLHNVLVFIVPILIYFVFTKDLKTITIHMNRTKKE